jgi:hypothetical protein
VADPGNKKSAQQCCGTGTGTFSHSGTGTHIGSGTGFGSGSNTKCNIKVKKNFMANFLGSDAASDNEKARFFTKFLFNC